MIQYFMLRHKNFVFFEPIIFKRLSIMTHLYYHVISIFRRGFTLQGMSITDKDKNAAVTNIDMMTINEEGDACAYYFWAITLFFFVIALINFFVLVSIVFVLGIGPHGMEAIEFLPDLQSVKFLKDLYASDITIGSGIIRLRIHVVSTKYI